MKSYNDLFDKITSEENILAAVHEAARHKRHKKAVRSSLARDKELAGKISSWLRNGSWRPVELHECTIINDGINLKKRPIVCPAFVKEQIVHHAIMRVVYPLFAKKMYRYSCGSVKGKGSEFAKKYIKKVIQADSGQTKYATHIDIMKFFNTVKPSTVFRAIRRTIRDRKTLGLIARILRSNKMRMDKAALANTAGLTILSEDKKGRVIVKGGLPIGFYTSPIFANVLLTSLDHFVKEVLRVPVYVRYMDDMLLMGNNKRKLSFYCNKIEEFLKTLGLCLKSKPAIHKFGNQSRAIDFMGFLISRAKIILRDKVFLRTKRALKRLSKKIRLNRFDACRIVAMAGRFKNADMRSVFSRLFFSVVSIKACRRIISQAAKRGLTYGI